MFYDYSNLANGVGRETGFTGYYQDQPSNLPHTPQSAKTSISAHIKTQHIHQTQQQHVPLSVQRVIHSESRMSISWTAQVTSRTMFHVYQPLSEGVMEERQVAGCTLHHQDPVIIRKYLVLKIKSMPLQFRWKSAATSNSALISMFLIAINVIISVSQQHNIY